MKFTKLLRQRFWLSGVFVAAVYCGAAAQDISPGPITLVTPFTPGSGSDAVARALAFSITESFGRPIIVQNVPGVGGAIGAKQVARSTPDGHMLLLASTSFSVLPSVFKGAGFDPIKDFVPVTMAGLQPSILVVPSTLPANSLNELIGLAKAQPGKLNYASSGVGSIGHLQFELLKQDKGLNIVHVPYKGTPESIMGMVSGEVHMCITQLPASMPMIKQGRLKALAVTGDKRMVELPEVPTMTEAGFPVLSDSSIWYSILVPAGTPQGIVSRLNAAFVDALRKPETAARLAAARTDPMHSTPKEAADYVTSQVRKWQKVVQDTKIQIEL